MPNDLNLGIQLQPLTVQVDGVPHEMLYGATEPEYVGVMPLRMDLEVLPLPPDQNSQGDLSFASSLAVPDDSYDSHTLVALAQSTTGIPEGGPGVVSNSWSSDWGPALAPHPIPLEFAPSGGIPINSDNLDNDIRFYSKGGAEVLRITGGGDFLVQGRLVKNDMDVYNAFRVFLGLSLGIPPKPGSRDGIPTRYERILKKPTENQ